MNTLPLLVHRDPGSRNRLVVLPVNLDEKLNKDQNGQRNGKHQLRTSSPITVFH